MSRKPSFGVVSSVYYHKHNGYFYNYYYNSTCATYAEQKGYNRSKRGKDNQVVRIH